MARGREKKKHAGIAAERIRILFGLAESAAESGELGQAHEYVDSALKISTRTKTRIPKELKRKVCRNCWNYLLPGVNARVRLDSKYKRVEVFCRDCEHTNHYPYVKEKKK